MIFKNRIRFWNISKLPRINLNFRLRGMNVVSGIDFLNEVMGKIDFFF